MSYLDNAKYTLVKINPSTPITDEEKMNPVPFSIQQIFLLDFKLKSKDGLEIDLFSTPGDYAYFKKIVELFDTLHDFSKYGICYDSIMYNRANTENYYDNIVFYFLAKFGFSLEDINIPKYFSNFSTTAGTVPSLLSVKELENYFCLHSIYSKITSGTNDFFFLDDCKSVSNPKVMGNNIADLFERRGWKDNATGKINLIIDTSKSLGDCIDGIGRFAYILTQESINDPSGKLSKFDIPKITSVYGEDGYYYESPGQKRVYKALNNKNPNGDHATLYDRNYTIFDDVEGLYDMQFNGLEIEGKKMKCSISLNNGIEKEEKICVLNASKNHINCITQVKKDVNKILSQTKQFIVPDNNLERNIFYPYVNNKASELFENQKIKDFVRLFSQKRYGDALEKGIVGMVNRKKIPEFKCKTINDEEKIITKLVLITIDRMLFSYSVLCGEPAILDGGDYMILYIPEYPSSVTAPEQAPEQTVSVPAPVPVPVPVPAPAPEQTVSVLPPAPPPRRSARIKPTKGGTHEDDINLIIEEVLNEPIILFEILPLVLRNKLANREEGPLSRCLSILNEVNNSYYNILYTNRVSELPILCNYKTKNITALDEQLKSSIDSITNTENIDETKLMIYVNIEDEIQIHAGRNGTDDKIYLSFLREKNLNKVSSSQITNYYRDNLDIDEDVVRGIINSNVIITSSQRGGKSEYYGGVKKSRTKQYFYFIENPSEFDNKQILQIYLELLEYYELLLCINDEQINIDFTELSSSIYIADKKSLYLFFQKLTHDKTSVSYKDLEYCLYNSKFGKKLYNDLNDIKLFILGNDYYDSLVIDYKPPTLRQKININIFDKIIKKCYDDEKKKYNKYDKNKNTERTELIQLFNRHRFSELLYEFNERKIEKSRETKILEKIKTYNNPDKNNYDEKNTYNPLKSKLNVSPLIENFNNNKRVSPIAGAGYLTRRRKTKLHNNNNNSKKYKKNLQTTTLKQKTKLQNSTRKLK
jgi:hypothetical protein